MKSENFTDPNNAVNRALGEWKITASLPPRFKDQVWRRIEAVENRISPWGAISAWAESLFAKPAMAMSYVTVLTLLGLALGFVQAEKKSSRFQAQLSARYVQSIDPYQRTH